MEITPGNLIDQLGIVNTKIYFLENVKRDKNASDKDIADATRKTNQLNTQRNKLIQAIDKVFGKETGQGDNKLY